MSDQRKPDYILLITHKQGLSEEALFRLYACDICGATITWNQRAEDEFMVRHASWHASLPFSERRELDG